MRLDSYEDDELVAEMHDRGFLVSTLRHGQSELEDAYESLLRGRPEQAATRLARILNPDGGCDAIKARVDADLKAAIERAEKQKAA
jgi:hypothetical protein